MSRKNNNYTGEYKQKVVEFMLENKMGVEAVMHFFPEIKNKTQPEVWKKIYQNEGVEALYKRRNPSGKPKGRPPKPPRNMPETLEEEVLRLRVENEYLKKLNALVQQRKKSAKPTE